MTLPLIGKSSASDIPASEASIICGYGYKQEGYFNILKQTTKIPYVRKIDNANFYFGCNITIAAKYFMVNAEITPPSLHNLDSNVGYLIDDSKTIVTKPLSGHELAYVIFWLDEKDPEGVYNVKLFIDKKYAKAMSFDIRKSYNNSIKIAPSGLGPR